MDLIQNFKIYVSVVEAGGFATAANLLQIQPSAVTKAVKALEDRLGVRLLNRTTRQVSLTAEGKIFYERCVTILKDIDRACDSIRAVPRKPRGRLRVDLPVMLATSVIIPSLPEFQERYPDIELAIGVTDRVEHIVRGGIDCALRVGELPDSSLIAKRLGTARMITCASAAYLEKYGEPRTLEDLENNHRAVHYFVHPGTKVISWQFVVDRKPCDIRLKHAVLIDQVDAYIAAGTAGLGIVQTLEPFLKPYIDKGTLVPVLQEFPCMERSVAFVYPDKENMPLKTSVFMEWAAGLLKESGFITG